MRISFDLDDCIFVTDTKFPIEPPLSFPFNKLFTDKLRKGTPELMKRLQKDGHEVWIYTTSFRSEKYIRGYFRLYGIRLDGVVNGYRHAEEVQRDKGEAMPSKYPSYYRIGLHIDDDVSVKQNGRQYGFKVYITSPDDDKWTENILELVRKIRNK